MRRSFVHTVLYDIQPTWLQLLYTYLASHVFSLKKGGKGGEETKSCVLLLPLLSPPRLFLVSPLSSAITQFCTGIPTTGTVLGKEKGRKGPFRQ